MKILYFFESIRTPFLDGLMSLLTKLGEETIFIALAIILFWCIDKKQGYFLIAIGFLGTFINQFLKVLFRVPRPWVKDPDFTIVESAREGATGYSFPSGHTQSAVGSFGGVARYNKNKWIKIVGISIAVIVPITRMYLGVHTFNDVFVSTIIALLLIFGIYPIINRSSQNPIFMYLLFGFIAVFGVFAYLFIKFYNFPSDVDANNIQHGLESITKLLGASIGVLVAYFIERRYINFETKGNLVVQVIKTVLGLVILVLLKSLLKTPINALIGAEIGNAVRYFIIIIFAVIVWPLVFKPLNNLYKKLFANKK